MGTTEFLFALKMTPKPVHRLLGVITDFLVDWMDYQRECFPSIDGLLVLDDIVGFVSGQRLRGVCAPVARRACSGGRDRQVLPQRRAVQGVRALPGGIGINLLNFGIQHTLTEMRAWTGGRVALMGNVPPRDVLAAGTPADVTRAVTEMLGARRGHLAPDRLVWRRHAARRPDLQHRGVPGRRRRIPTR